MGNWQFFSLLLISSFIWYTEATEVAGCTYSGPPNIQLFIPHEKQCHLFYRLDMCPTGLLFNTKTQLCDLPSNTNCGPRKTPADHLNVDTNASSGKYVGGECPTLKSCPPFDPFGPLKFVPHLTDCSLYCGCLKGSEVLYRCPSILHFNPSTSKCDLPSRAGCKSSQIVTSGREHNISETDFVGGYCPSSVSCPSLDPLSSKVFLPHSSMCNLFCGCKDGTSNLYRCPNNLHFNPKLKLCDLPSHAGCTSESNGNIVSATEKCPTLEPCPTTDPVDHTLYLPHLTDCKLFCRCSHGVAMLHSCANGLLFNPKRQTCDLPKNAGCVSNLNTSTINNGSIDGTMTNNNNGQQDTSHPGEICPAVGQCPKLGSLSRKIVLPHRSNCSLYCECWQGVPRLRRCGSGLHFSGVTNRCENPSQARCQGDCAKILPTTGSVWEPESCVKDLSRMGDKCRISCLSGYELIGSSNIACTEKGWNGTGGLNVLPKCKVPEELGIEFVDNIAKEVSGPDSDFLFMLDESGSLSPEQFGTQLSFVKAVVSAFPLSQKRYAGVLTFSGSAWVDVNMKHGDTCKFLNAVQKIKYQGGTTDIRLALVTATREILKNSVHNRTLVFLITDGQSDTDPTLAANTLKKEGNVLFTVGIGDYERRELESIASVGKDGAPLFYGITNFVVFNKIAEYLHTVHGHGVKLNCP
ncbi:matrilin-2-like [Periplaneta americana]|uniref:matrilin-2-like n=1 Tax=Periplaneta americana TaxID=6978 RepID=UPI0037E71CB5